jgi:serine/threonine protein kinase
MKLRRRSDDTVLRIDAGADKLGEGGEGAVYRVGKDLVAKIYTKQVRDARAKIDAMVQNPPEDNATKGHRSIAWPVDLLMDANNPSQFRGYLMPRVDAGVELHRIWEFQTRVKLGYTAHELHVVALNIASAFQALHQKGYVIGDVNDRNVLINERGLATVIDTDSFQVPRKGGGWFRCGVCTGEFTPPELQKVTNFRQIDRREEHDLFGLGVLLFKVLMLGHHPFSGRTSDTSKQGWPLEVQIQKANFPFGPTQSPFTKPPAAPALDVLAPELGEMFVECFETGKRDPAARPRAGDWRAALNRARKDLETCSTNPMHRFTGQRSACPWCEIRDRVKMQGTGLDYFPTDAAQIPLPKPARPKQKPKVHQVSSGSSVSSGRSTSSIASLAAWHAQTGSSSSGSSSRPGSSISSLAAQLAAAPSKPSSTTAQPSTPSLGSLIGDLLVTGISAYLSNSAARQRNGNGAAGMSAQPEIGPGRWQFQVAAPPRSWEPTLVGADVYFEPVGSFFGSGLMFAMGRRVPCQLGGRWQYDSYGKVLTVDAVIDGMPAPRTELRIVGGRNGQYQMVDGVGNAVGAMRLA